jgi:hypothetical protein
MKKALLSAAALSALAVAAPAAAQYQNGYQTGPQRGDYRGDQNDDYGVAGNANFSARIGRLQAQLDAGVRAGEIDRREAWQVRQQLTQLSQLERRYAANGFTGQERADLQQRLRAVREQLRMTGGGYGQQGYGQPGYGPNGQSGGGQYGNNGYGNEDHYSDRDRDGLYDADERMDSNGDGYDDRDYNRNGRWDDQPGGASQGRGGIGGVIDQVIGGGSLRVGDRASANLGAVPSQYRSQYRDTSNAYYRSDGRAIYQIDARSQAVMRVYPIGR